MYAYKIGKILSIIAFAISFSTLASSRSVIKSEFAVTIEPKFENFYSNGTERSTTTTG